MELIDELKKVICQCDDCISCGTGKCPIATRVIKWHTAEVSKEIVKVLEGMKEKAAFFPSRKDLEFVDVEEIDLLIKEQEEIAKRREI